MKKEQVLLIEDDADIREGVRILLESENYCVEEAENGKSGLELLSDETDLVILDIMMPGMSGLRTCEEIRKVSNVPVLFLTAKAQESDKLIGLMAGGDDYLAKPFSVKELMARVRSQTRRHGAFNPGKMTLGNTTLDVEAAKVEAGNTISLSPKEARLLLYFMKNEGKSLDEISVYGHLGDEGTDHDQATVWLYVNYLKRKLASVQSDLTIEEQSGGPYKLVQCGVNGHGSH